MQGVSSTLHLCNPPKPVKLLSVCFSNVRSLLDEFRPTCLSLDCDIFGVTETWLSEEILDSEVYVPGYSVLRRDRNRHGGGIALFIRDNLNFEVILLPTNDIELMLVRVLSMDFSFVLAISYRPPHSSVSMEVLYYTLQSLNASILNRFVLVGDFNINMLDPQTPF